ncbi:MAG TPA: hypothetical protein VGQ38_04855 [Gaiellaceae bacterium]|nr:hypothetical protein [Gaiellaceae bacterium]
MPRALWVKAPLALLRHRAGFVAVLCAALLVAMGASAAPLMRAGAESEALKSKLEQLTPLGAGLSIERPLAVDKGDIATADAKRRKAATAFGRTLPYAGRPVLTTSTDGVLGGRSFELGVRPVEVVPMARTDATSHVLKLKGDGRGVWLSSGVGAVSPGERVTFGPGQQAYRVGAVYRQLDSDLSNPYWVNFIIRIRPPGPDAELPPTFALMTPAQVYSTARLSHALANDYEYPINTAGMTPGRARQIARSTVRVRREIATGGTLATSLGCERHTCHVTSSLADAVTIAKASISGLAPVIDLLATFCVLVALGTAMLAGVFTGRRRAAEGRLSLAGGESGAAFFARSGLEGLVPAVVGAIVGFGVALELVSVFTPDGSIDSSVVRQAGVRAALSILATAAVVALGVTVARGRLGDTHSRLRFLARIPWELVVAVAALAAWILLSSGSGLVKDPVAGSHPRLAVLLLPALVAAPLAGVVGRLLRSVVFRRVGRAPVAAFLALRRVGAARGLVVALTVTVAAGVASLAFAQVLRSSLATNSHEKALVANGSDVQGLIDSTRDVPASFPFPATRVTEVFSAGQLQSGRRIDVITVDPKSLERVLASHWPRSTVDAVRVLADSDEKLPAIGVGVPSGRQTVTLGQGTTDVHVVSTLRAFPGMQPNGSLLVVPEHALNVDPGAGLTYVWASGPPRQVEAALGRSSLAPSYLTVLADFSRNPDVANVTRTYGFLRIVAAAVVLLAFVALILYLSGRERAQLVTSAFLRRMGFSQGRQAVSVALEVGILVLVATASGVVAALVTSGAIVGHVDPLAQYSPVPVADIPWTLLVVSVVVGTAVAALVGALLTLVVRRSDIGEALRVS